MIYSTDEIVHHAIYREGREIHSKTYRIGELSGTKRVLPQIEDLKWKGKTELASRLERKCRNMIDSSTRKILSCIFK